MNKWKQSAAVLNTIAAFATLLVVTLYFAMESFERGEEVEQLRREMTSMNQQMGGLEDSLGQIYALSHNLNSLALIRDEEHPETTASDHAIAQHASANRQGHDSLRELLSVPVREDYTLMERFRDIKNNSRNLERKLRSLATVIQHREDLLSSIPSITPTQGWISSTFGPRISPFTGERVMHNGMDIGASRGTKVIATADGEVIFSGMSGTFGKTVVIDHGFGILTRYAHASALTVEKNAKVRRGDIVAVVGSTGRSTGPHLHYEVIIDGKQVDPKNFLLDMPTDYIHLANADESTAIGGDGKEEVLDTGRSRILFPLKLALLSVALGLICLAVPTMRLMREQQRT